MMGGRADSSSILPEAMASLDDRHYIIPAGLDRVAEELAKRGVEPIEIQYDQVSYWGGCVSCSTHAISRRHGKRTVSNCCWRDRVRATIATSAENKPRMIRRSTWSTAKIP